MKNSPESAAKPNKESSPLPDLLAVPPPLASPADPYEEAYHQFELSRLQGEGGLVLEAVA